MIVLVGPSRWEQTMQRGLTDRTSHTGHNQVVASYQIARHMDLLRGKDEHMELVQCIDPSGSWLPNPHQQEVIALVKELNKLYLARVVERYNKEKK